MLDEMVSKTVRVLVRRYVPTKVILFGSYAWGRPTKDSDIDLFIVKNTRKRPSERFVEVQKVLYGSHGSVPVETLVLTPKELEVRIQQKDPFIVNYRGLKPSASTRKN